MKIFELKNVFHVFNIHPLSKNLKYRVGIYFRFLNWQLRKKFFKNGMIIQWVNNTRLILYPGRANATGNYYFGLLEYEPMAFLLHYIRHDDVVYDIGANIGVYSVLLGNKAKHVISFEPAKDTAEILQENIGINHLTNVTIVAKGVSDKEETVQFTKNKDSINHIVSEEGKQQKNIETIKTVTLDNYVKESYYFPNIVKIDTEGSEGLIIKGAENILSDNRLNIIVMEIFGDEEFSRILEKSGFQLYLYNPKKRSLMKGNAKDAGMNGIYIRDIKLAEKRVKLGENIIYRHKKI